MIINIKKIRYFETRQGVGYEVKTDKGTIWNDGTGGATYFVPDYPRYNNNQFRHLTEWDLEALIDKFEGVVR